MRKRLRIVLGLAVAGVLAAPVTLLGVHVTHPRDEDSYLAYLKQYGGMESRPLPVLPPTADLLAEGDAACDWMREQPYALWRTGPEFRHLPLHQRYLRHVGDRSPSWGSHPRVGTVTAAAWEHLCPAEWELRQSRRNPFAPKPD